METTRKDFALGRRASEADEGSQEQTLLFHLSELQSRFQEVAADLVRQGAEVTRRVESTLRSVEAGQNVNELGELQSAGPRFDQLCAVHQERAANLRRALFLARSLGVEVTDEEVF